MLRCLNTQSGIWGCEYLTQFTHLGLQTENVSRQKQRRMFLLSLPTPTCSPKEQYLLRNHSWTWAASLQHTGSLQRGLLSFSPSASAITYLAPVASGINNIMIIQTKWRPSSVNKFNVISYMFGKLLCTILQRILKIHIRLSYVCSFSPWNMRNVRFNDLKNSRLKKLVSTYMKKK